MKKTFLLAAAAVIAFAGVRAEGQTPGFSYFPLTPCRVADTRNPTATNGGPIMGSNASRDFSIRGRCNVPTGAKAVSLNVTITGATSSSWLALWPSGQARPTVSTINFESTDPALANGAIVGLSTNTNDLSVYNNLGNVHVIIDVTGYFQ